MWGPSANRSSGAVDGLRYLGVRQQFPYRVARLRRLPATPLSAVGPGRQPSMTVILPASASKTRPVTPSPAAEPSQTTRGDTSSGSAVSPANVSSVILVRAAGAMALTWTPYRPSSAAATSVRPMIAALAAA